jgi:hypothetical protein
MIKIAAKEEPRACGIFRSRRDVAVVYSIENLLIA